MFLFLANSRTSYSAFSSTNCEDNFSAIQLLLHKQENKNDIVNTNKKTNSVIGQVLTVK